MPSKETVVALKERLSEIDRNRNYYEYMTIYCNLKRELARSKEEDVTLRLEQEKDIEYNALPAKKKISLIRKFINFIKNIFAKKEKAEVVPQKEEEVKKVEDVKVENIGDTKTENIEDTTDVKIEVAEVVPQKEEETDVLDMTMEEELLEEIDDDIPDVDISVPDLKEDNLSIDIGDNVDRKIV